MAAFYGTGTMFYGWGRVRGRTASATRWLTVCYLPIMPLGRYRVKLPPSPRKGLLRGVREVLKFCRGPVALCAWAPVQWDYRPVRREGFGLTAAIATYLKAYLLLPLAVVLPAALAVFAAGLAGNSTELGFWTFVVGILAWAAWFIGLIAWSLNRARYGPLADRQ